MSVYKAITDVSADIAKTGIGKDRSNQQQGYKFRGIDDVYNELAPLLAKHKLCILPRVLARECIERVTAKGGAIFYVTVDAEFDFVSAVDGSKHTVKTFGEAMDSADKATNKAMSAAYKYAAFQAFCIPTEGDNDADSTTHEVKPQPKRQPSGLSPLDALKKELADYTADPNEQKVLLAQATKSTGDDGKEKWMDLNKLDTYSPKAYGFALGKVREYIDNQRKEKQ